MTAIEWPLANWNKPDLDHGYIIHRSKTTAEIQKWRMAYRWPVINAAERYAKQAAEAGIAVTADEWTLIGYDAV